MGFLMGRFRWLLYGLLGVVSTVLTVVFTPGTWLNRVISLSLCGLLSGEPAMCSAFAVKRGDQAVATEVPLLAQRDREFFDPPPSEGTPPSFGQDPGPDFIRDDFRGGQPSPTSGQSRTQDTFPRSQATLANFPDDFELVNEVKIDNSKVEVTYESVSTGVQIKHTQSNYKNTGDFKIYRTEVLNVSGEAEEATRNFSVSFNEKTKEPLLIQLGNGMKYAFSNRHIRVIDVDGSEKIFQINAEQSDFFSNALKRATLPPIFSEEDSQMLLSYTRTCEEKFVDAYEVRKSWLEAGGGIATILTSAGAGAVAGGGLPGAAIGAGIGTVSVIIGTLIKAHDIEKGKYNIREEAQKTCNPSPPEITQVIGGNYTTSAVPYGSTISLLVSYRDYNGDVTHQVTSGYEIGPESGEGKLISGSTRAGTFVSYMSCVCSNSSNSCQSRVFPMTIRVYDSEGNMGSVVQPVTCVPRAQGR